ncbi:MAG: caspase family protein [Elusimicrobia bacterium]|nr:caspase family protein [Elusimicrobiota bacterium]
MNAESLWLIRGRQALALLLCFSLSSCATLAVTPELKPAPPARAVAGKLGIQYEGEQLKRVFAAADRSAIGAASGQFFSDVTVLPPESRYAAPQDLFDQYGTDLILQAQVADTVSNGAVNALFASCFLLMWFCIATVPQMTMTDDVTLQGNLRDSRTGRLLWAGTVKSRGTDHFTPMGSSGIQPLLVQRVVHNAVIELMQTAAGQVSGYRPESVKEESLQAAVRKAPGLANLHLLHPAAKSKNRYAIVIGIDRYREHLPKADFAADDARDVAKFLIERAGYPEENVVVRLNEEASKGDMEKYFESWAKNNVDASSSLLVYYSGHGSPDVNNGDAYIVPYDGDPAYIEQTGYPLKKLYRVLDGLPSKNTLVLLDSCFSGAGGRSVLMAGARPLVNVKPVSVSDQGKTVVLSATSGNHISVAYRETGHGLFTHYLLQGLSGEADANGDNAVDVQELYEYLRPQVERVARKVYNTEQVPQLIEPAAMLGSPPIRIVVSQ